MNGFLFYSYGRILHFNHFIYNERASGFYLALRRWVGRQEGISLLHPPLSFPTRPRRTWHVPRHAYGLLRRDGVHLSDDGRLAYIEEVVNALSAL